MKFPRIFALFLLISIGLTACSVSDLFGNFGVANEVTPSEDTLVMGFAEAPDSYSPLTYKAVNRRYLSNIYEPLVRYDANFNLKTGLAVSWGRYDDFTWEFRLRDGVYFHDGSALDADDVVYSFDLAMHDTNSELTSLLSNIVSVEKNDKGKVEIVTKTLDPLLLHKLTSVYIVPDEHRDFSTPIGTGPYYISEVQDGEISLDRFPDYWGNQPYFSHVDMKYMPDVQERYDGILNGDLDFLINVPPQYADDIRSQGIGVFSFPSLEVSFLMMSEGGIFADSNLRAAVWNAVQADYGDQLGAGYLEATNQFAATGIAGYENKSVERGLNLSLAEEFRAKHDGDVEVTLDLPFGLESLGSGIVRDLSAIDIIVDLNFLHPEELQQKILSGESDFYFFGWKYDLADSADFYQSVVASGAKYNGISYSNPTIDDLIDEINDELDESVRLLLLKKIAQELLADQVILPLFESRILFATKPGIDWQIRLDGQVLASEIMRFVVK